MFKRTTEPIKPVLIRAAKTALIVGPVLTLINQYDAVMGRDSFNVLAIALTFMVPFCVSAYSGIQTRRTFLDRMAKMEKSHADTVAQLEKDAAARREN